MLLETFLWESAMLDFMRMYISGSFIEISKKNKNKKRTTENKENVVLFSSLPSRVNGGLPFSHMGQDRPFGGPHSP